MRTAHFERPFNSDLPMLISTGPSHRASGRAFRRQVCVVKGNEPVIGGRTGRIDQVYALQFAVVLLAVFSPGLLDEYPSNGFRSSCKKMAPPVPFLGLLDIDKPHVCLMNQRGRLK